METKEELLLELDTYAKVFNISRAELAKRLEIPYSTVKHWFLHGESAKKPSQANLLKIRAFLKSKETLEAYQQQQESRRRVKKVKYLLLLLEDELQWFIDSNPSARETFRKELNSSDIGYISSLLAMMSNEDSFNRWLALTTISFKYFQGK